MAFLFGFLTGFGSVLAVMQLYKGQLFFLKGWEWKDKSSNKQTYWLTTVVYGFIAVSGVVMMILW